MDTRPDWIIHYVFDDPRPYPYLYNAHTHGMEKYQHLDFQAAINFRKKHICYLLNTMGMRVRNGEAFHDGNMVSDIYVRSEFLLLDSKTGDDGVVNSAHSSLAQLAAISNQPAFDNSPNLLQQDNGEIFQLCQYFADSLTDSLLRTTCEAQSQ